MGQTQKPLEITEHTVVLDARSSFDYGLNRVQNSISFPWEKLAENAKTGEVLRDTRRAGRQLALLGLRPTTPVVIVGYGPQGHGEEGRLAWTLLYLGFQNVQVSGIEALRKTMTPLDTPPVRNESVWPVNLREELQMDREAFLEWTTKRKPEPEVAAAEPEILLDVRSALEFAGPPASQGTGKARNVRALNFEWSKLFTHQGRPDPRSVERLAAMGVRPESHIVLVSNRGVRSAAAAFALISLGFANTQNFTGGWNSL